LCPYYRINNVKELLLIVGYVKYHYPAVFDTGGAGSGQKILTDFEFYIRKIAGLDEVMVLLL
jgi:hypothetical protein